MKVINIEKYPARDGSDRWKVLLEDDPSPLIMGVAPDFPIGTDLPKDRLKLTSKNHAYFYTLVKQEEAQFMTPAEKSASIEGQVVWRGIIDCFIAGKLDELTESQNRLAKAIVHYAERRLVQDHPMIEEVLGK